jgi:hypothetical protein
MKKSMKCLPLPPAARLTVQRANTGVRGNWPADQIIAVCAAVANGKRSHPAGQCPGLVGADRGCG